MAQPSTITNEVRARVTNLVRDLHEVETIVHIIEDTGDSDLARKNFFEEYLLDDQGNPVTDITWTEFQNVVLSLRDLQTWLETNRPILAKIWQ